MPFNSENLMIFLTVIEKGSFSAAARALHKVPSAVSMAVANLEAELGFSLFERHTREPKPTEKALALVPYARNIVDNLRQLNIFSRELTEGVESTLTIGVAEGINPNILLESLKTLSQRYPLMHVELITAAQDDILPLLHEHKIQLAMAFGGLYVNSQEQFYCIGYESLVATISANHPSIAQQANLFIEDLVHTRQIVVTSFQRRLSDIRSVVSTNYWRVGSFAMALGLVKAGMGWGNLPNSLIKDQLKFGSLKQLEFKNTPNGLVLPIHIVCLKGQVLKRGAQELIELLKTNNSTM